MTRDTRIPAPKPPIPPDLPADTRVRRLSSGGSFGLENVTYMIDGRRAFEHVLIITDGNHITVTDTGGEILAELTRPAPGIKYVGNGRPRGPRHD